MFALFMTNTGVISLLLSDSSHFKMKATHTSTQVEKQAMAKRIEAIDQLLLQNAQSRANMYLEGARAEESDKRSFWVLEAILDLVQAYSDPDKPRPSVSDSHLDIINYAEEALCAMAFGKHGGRGFRNNQLQPTQANTTLLRNWEAILVQAHGAATAALANMEQ